MGKKWVFAAALLANAIIGCDDRAPPAAAHDTKFQGPLGTCREKLPDQRVTFQLSGHTWNVPCAALRDWTMSERVGAYEWVGLQAYYSPQAGYVHNLDPAFLRSQVGISLRPTPGNSREPLPVVRDQDAQGVRNGVFVAEGDPRYGTSVFVESTEGKPLAHLACRGMDVAQTLRAFDGEATDAGAICSTRLPLGLPANVVVQVAPPEFFLEGLPQSLEQLIETINGYAQPEGN